MKPHLILHLRRGVRLPPIRAWVDAVTDKSGVARSLTPAIDALFRRNDLPGWVLAEYPPADRSGRFGPDEIAAGLDRVVRYVLEEDTTIPAALVAEIRLLPEVQHARIGRLAATELPTARTASARTDVWSRERVGLPEAHVWERGLRDVTVAVLDTGVDGGHRELKSALREGYDFVDIIDGAGVFLADYLGADDDWSDPVGHGTHVAGIVGSEGLAMPEGVAPGCSLLPVRVLGALRQAGRPVGAGLVDNINTALKWTIDQDPDVINMSFGLPRTGGGLPHREVVEYGLRRGVTMVAAAGNDGSRELYYPGSLPGVIAVGATDPEDGVAPFSTYGPQVLLTAPGTEIYSSFPGDGYAFASGTSQASPFVAGAAALIQSLARRRLGRRLGVEAVRGLLARTADRTGAPFRTPQAGYGRLNVADALRLLDLEIARSATPDHLDRALRMLPGIDIDAERTGP